MPELPELSSAAAPQTRAVLNHDRAPGSETWGSPVQIRPCVPAIAESGARNVRCSMAHPR